MTHMSTIDCKHFINRKFFIESEYVSSKYNIVDYLLFTKFKGLFVIVTIRFSILPF